MQHFITRATILPEIVALIMDKFRFNEKEALAAFYCSATGASFADDDTGLYGQSPNFIFGLYNNEIDEKILHGQKYGETLDKPSKTIVACKSLVT